jgi:ribonuclease HII
VHSIEIIAGVDEAGRGPLAGPVVVAAVVLDPANPIDGLADSKVLSAARRERLFEVIVQKASQFQVIMVDVKTIDQINILQATLLGMRASILNLSLLPNLVLIDGKQVPKNMPCKAKAIIDGDAIEPCISAASILAKVTRDRHMKMLDEKYPGYGFAKHKGYGTAQHLKALAELGPCAEHRLSFAPVSSSIMQQQLL